MAREVQAPLLGSDVRSAIERMSRDLEELKDLVEASARYGAWLVDLNHPRLKLNLPLFVLVEELGDEVIARSPELRVVARGRSEEEAILAYKQAVVGLYEELRDEPREALGPAMRALQSAILALASEQAA